MRVDSDGPVTTVTIDRPEVRNAVDRATAEALAEAFRAFDADDAAAVAVLTGAGGHFCAGADLKAVGQGHGNRVEADGDGPMGPSRMRLTKPVVAAIEGYAVAGGLELAIWADLRVASRDAVLGVFCRRWGVPLIDGGTVRLPRLIGESRAMDLVLTGRGSVRPGGPRDGAGEPAVRAGRGAGRGPAPRRGDRSVPPDVPAAGPAQRPGAVGAATSRRPWAPSSPMAWCHCRQTHWPVPPASRAARGDTVRLTVPVSAVDATPQSRPEHVQDPPPQ